RALLQPAIILGREFIIDGDTGKTERNSIYRNMDHGECIRKLDRLMQEEKMFRDPDISLSLLAEKMEVTRNYTSYLVNDIYHMTFFDFINSYRINEVKGYMEKDNITNLLNIAFQAGFNSKTTFNVAFKKNTGMTPTQYRNKLKKEHSRSA
ncbi:MAG: AraC family transcriptional regulator, partial [Spirochaetales bacterium]|nr:AraC family transcriptional regulator [Spirochaetales bacterium]